MTSRPAQARDLWTRRRDWLIAALGTALADAASAQTTPALRRIGWLGLVDSFGEPYALAFVRRLRELGWVEGQNLVIERRHADGQGQRLPGLAAELAGLGCDLFFAPGNEANLLAIKAVGSDTPIVIVANDYDPVAARHVATLARPGGRITGVTPLASTLPAKRLELLKELLPGARKVAVFSTTGTTGQLESLRAAAPQLGVALQVVDFRQAPFDYDAAFAELQRARVDALFVLSSGAFVPDRGRLPALALKQRLPTVFGTAQWADAGALLSYGVSLPVLYRRAAEMVAQILRGARPGEMPLEQATSFELVLNLRTARALGLNVPRAVLVRADRLIE